MKTIINTANMKLTSLKALLPLSLVVLLATGIGCTTTPTEKVSDIPSLDSYGEVTLDDEAIAVETTDVYGKDITGVERYTDSIRSYYSSNEYETDVTYQTTATIEQVRQFYNDQLTGAGWSNSEEATDYMEYTKGDDQNPEIMTVYFTEYDQQGLLEYELVYEPALSDAQLQDIEE